MKTPKTIDKIMFAPCGMDCMFCYAHLRVKNTCPGCLHHDAGKVKHCINCGIRNCTAEKKVTYCFQCQDFPCILIKKMEKRYVNRYQISLIENSRIVSEKGFELFFKKEKKRWKCSKCSSAVSLHSKICSECGRKT